MIGGKDRHSEQLIPASQEGGDFYNAGTVGSGVHFKKATEMNH